MLNIYRSRESLDKESFIYGKIKESRKETLVIVPDQYTLVAEQQAMSRMDTDVLLDVEISAISKFGSNVLEETGRSPHTYIDEYGRYMLLYKILSEQKDRLEVFGGVVQKQGFLESINDFISKAKQANLDIQTVIDSMDDEASEVDELTRRKLSDIKLIFDEYENSIRDKYTDAEDLLRLYTAGIDMAESLKRKTVWIYGFDSFTNRNLEMLAAIIRQAEEVNIFFTYDEHCKDEEIFEITGNMSDRLIELCKESNVEFKVHDLGKGSPYAKLCKRSPGIKAIEKSLFSPFNEEGLEAKGIKIVRANNIYSEAESAASFVLDLLEEKKLRYKDIVVICNETKRAEVLKRVFQEYGIGIFTDKKRAIASSPIAVFVVSLIEAVSSSMRTLDVFRVIKTGFIGIDEEDVDFIENYAIKYKVRGNQWFSPFTKGAFEYGDEGLARLNEIREQIAGVFDGFKKIYKSSKTNKEFIESYVDFLINKADIGSRIDELVESLSSNSMQSKADETTQTWPMLISAFEQIIELMGDDKFSGKTFASILTAGLLQMEVGVVPPVSDEILLGTMQRTRCGDVKAMLIFGANEGILPLEANESQLFSDSELKHITCAAEIKNSSEDVRQMEETLAIYRNFSRPEEYLWVGYSMADADGAEIRRSEIVERLLTMFPEIREEEDVVTSGRLVSILGGKTNTVRHFTEALKNFKYEGKIDSRWSLVSEWLRQNEEELYKRIEEGLEFENVQSKLPAEIVERLYSERRNDEVTSFDASGASYSLSPSRIEKFSKCPFSHFVSYGLRPEERREFAVSAREIGDLYHETIMHVTKHLSDEDCWQAIGNSELRDLVYNYIEAVSHKYREGIFENSNREKYWLERAKTACFEVCKQLVEQARVGKIEKSYYEERFGRRGQFPPIEVETEAGKVFIEGKIDRVDLLPGNRVKIIDYKTGRESFDKTEARTGYRLQLMLYLAAAQGNSRKPAGVFYFLISDPKIDVSGQRLSGITEMISKELKGEFKLKGILVDEPEVIKNIAGEFEESSEVIALSKKKDGEFRKTEALLSEAEFEELQGQVKAVTDKLCEDLVGGNIDIRPKKSGEEIPCTYCEYRGICRFDLAFDGCSYDVVK